MTGDDPTLCRRLQTLETLRALKPSRMVTRKPTLGNHYANSQ